MSPTFFDRLWIKNLNSNLRHSELRKTEPTKLIDERHGRKVTKAILWIAWSNKKVIEQGEKQHHFGRIQYAPSVNRNCVGFLMIPCKSEQRKELSSMKKRGFYWTDD